MAMLSVRVPDNTGHVTITPTKPIPEGNVSAKAYDNAEVPNVATLNRRKQLIRHLRQHRH